MEYVCKLGTASGQVLNQTEEALSETELRQRLQSAGYYVFSIEPRQFLQARFRGMRRGRIRPDDFLIFNQQFLTLSKSGLPLQKSLDMLARQTPSEELRATLENIRERVRAGELLSEAFDDSGKFPKIYSATLRAGERSGSLDRVLAQYVTYQKASRSFRKKFLSALIYPAFLLVFLFGLIAFVITFIVPRFALLYADLGVQLPALTRFVMEFSLGVKRLGLFILIGIVGTLLLLRGAWRLPATRLAWDQLKFRLPIVGKLLLKFSVAEFARALGTLLQGGIPIVSALGEATGALPSMLEALAEFFEEDVNIDLSTLVALVDPLMIASIAIVVAFVLIAFYLPLFSMAAQVH
ncbi:MAG: type II secretion system F family protein [Acidobacteriia bacterium]|nr:type II secretion system F family protein [Terriglobia bacterium]